MLNLHPTFSDFARVEKDPRAIFPYTFMVYNGNNSEAVAKVIRPRGFLKVPGRRLDFVDDSPGGVSSGGGRIRMEAHPVQS